MMWSTDATAYYDLSHQSSWCKRREWTAYIALLDKPNVGAKTWSRWGKVSMIRKTRQDSFTTEGRSTSSRKYLPFCSIWASMSQCSLSLYTSYKRICRLYREREQNFPHQVVLSPDCTFQVCAPVVSVLCAVFSISLHIFLKALQRRRFAWLGKKWTFYRTADGQMEACRREHGHEALKLAVSASWWKQCSTELCAFDGRHCGQSKVCQWEELKRG